MPKIEELIPGYTLVARRSRKGQPLPYLKEHQARFAQASKEAGEETKHLHGTDRVKRKNELIRQKLEASKQQNYLTRP